MSLHNNIQLHGCDLFCIQHWTWASTILSIFMGRNLGNKKKLTPVRIMNSVSLNNKNIMNNIGIFNDSVTMNSNFRGKYWDEQFMQILPI